MSAHRPSSKAKHAPRITDMGPDERHALLRSHHVGRMAYCFHDRVDIVPIHYVYADGWLFARTSHGHKMEVLGHAPWVAFEVDEIDGVFDWQSVVVHGTVHTMDPHGAPVDAEHWTRGIELLREIVPETGTEEDPVRFRDLVFGIYVQSIVGRVSTTRP